MNILLPAKSVLLTLTLALFLQPVEAKKMYKWVDENGKVSFSDKIPPSEVEYKREKINRHADVVEIIPKAKTKEEFAMEKRLNILRRRQEKLIAAQKNHDRVLISTFRDLKGMRATYAKKIAAFDAQRRVSENALDRAKEYLVKQQGKIAQHEINNQETPQTLLESLETTEKQIENIHLEIQKYINTRDGAQKGFDADIARFAFLTRADANANATPSKKTATEKAVEELGLFTCQNDTQCKEAWKAARQFVTQHSNTKISIDTAQIVMTAAPISSLDLSLSVSKMLGADDKQQIFLDIRCKDDMQGKKLCSSPKSAHLRASFNDAIKIVLGLKVTPKTELLEP